VPEIKMERYGSYNVMYFNAGIEFISWMFVENSWEKQWHDLKGYL
jgi:hypothetical protein